MAYSDRERIGFRSTSIVLDRGEVREARVGREERERRRSFDKGRWTYSCGGLPVPSPSLLDPRGYGLAPLEPGKSGKDSPKTDPRDLSLEEKLEFLREMEKRLSTDPRLSLRLSYQDVVLSVRLESGGVDLEQELVRTALTVVATARENGRMGRGIASDGARAGWEFIESFSPEIAAERALRTLKAEKLKGGEYTVILDPLMVGTLIHEALGHMVEGDTVAADASVLKGRLGDTIASSLLAVVDDGEKGYGSFFFDRDGSAPRKTALLEDGRLLSFLHSRDSAGQLGGASTGNCRGEFNAVRMTNTAVLPGQDTLDEMLDVKRGVFLCGTTGGATSPASRTFNFSADEGWLVENGELKKNVGEATLSGDLFEVLRSVDMVGKKVEMNGGSCGKSGESVAVGSGGPHLRAKAVVGGLS